MEDVPKRNQRQCIATCKLDNSKGYKLSRDIRLLPVDYNTSSLMSVREIRQRGNELIYVIMKDVPIN